MNKNQSNMMALVVAGLLGTCGILQASQTSERIESSAKNSYVFKTYLKDDKIKVEAINDSVVILTGTVNEWSHRSLAEETVAGIPGVVKVDNKLEATGGKPDESSNAWITMKIKTVLMFHSNVTSLTEVDVKNGVVVLHGKASSEAEKELTTEYVKDVEGVTSVTNKMTVAKIKKTTMEKVETSVDDASITAQVKLALLFHHSTSAINTKVETKNGVVTVKGVVKNGAEKDLVTKLVTDIKGVNGLNNEITIE